MGDIAHKILDLFQIQYRIVRYFRFSGRKRETREFEELHVYRYAIEILRSIISINCRDRLVDSTEDTVTIYGMDLIRNSNHQFVNRQKINE